VLRTLADRMSALPLRSLVQGLRFDEDVFDLGVLISNLLFQTVHSGGDFLGRQMLLETEIQS
jgi:hypothetical protein